MSKNISKLARLRPLRLLTMTAAATAAGAVLIASSAHAAAAPPLEPGDTYVALGSSYAAGAGLGAADPTDVGGRCGRSTIAYPFLVADALDLQLSSAACGGATIPNIASTPQLIRNPDGSTYLAPLQLDAVRADTDLVTITIGGNDVNYVGNLISEACMGDLATNPGSVLSNQLKLYGLCTPRPDSLVRDQLAGLQDSLTSMVRAVQERAPQARVVLVDYLTVLPENGKPCAVMPVPQDRQKFLLEVARELSLATKHAAQQIGAEFVAVSKASRGHDVCSADPWMTGYEPSGGLMHPSAAGHAAVAEAVVRQLTSPGSSS